MLVSNNSITFVASRVITLEHNNEELRNTNGCYLVTQFSSNPTNRFILSELSFLAKVTQIVCKCVVSAGEFEIVGAGNDPVDRFPMPEFVLLLRAGAMFSVEHSGLSVYSVFVRGRLRRPVVSLRNPGRILSDTALRGPGFAGVAVGEGPGSGGDRIKNSTTGIIFIKNNYLC